MLNCEQDKVSLRAGNASYFFSVTLHSFTLILLLTPANSKIVGGCWFFVCFSAGYSASSRIFAEKKLQTPQIFLCWHWT